MFHRSTTRINNALTVHANPEPQMYISEKTIRVENCNPSRLSRSSQAVSPLGNTRGATAHAVSGKRQRLLISSAYLITTSERYLDLGMLDAKVVLLLLC